MSNLPQKPEKQQAIPDQLIQIAHEQEGGAERVISQVEVAQNSLEEIQTLAKECQEIIARIVPPSPELEALINRLEGITTHADNGIYNIQGHASAVPEPETWAMLAGGFLAPATFARLRRG